VTRIMSLWLAAAKVLRSSVAASVLY